jgi:hypothetical protein
LQLARRAYALGHPAPGVHLARALGAHPRGDAAAARRIAGHCLAALGDTRAALAELRAGLAACEEDWQVCVELAIDADEAR